ncbi:hypothetical protein KIN20_033296 [Parelaphostrongylus tenuis]|uniref:Uncharacterized protein n=1 Tax=Parelaphostrongylus tenuis TaxID=148309 RepID=A0AAD5R8D1_PARTN|nr:hypothetical protein KIN20_033296 [Parelaphostrongylus tenuis]
MGSLWEADGSPYPRNKFMFVPSEKTRKSFKFGPVGSGIIKTITTILFNQRKLVKFEKKKLDPDERVKKVTLGTTDSWNEQGDRLF